MIRTVIADDHELIRNGYKNLISTETDITLSGEASSAEELMCLLSKLPFDILILDLHLPDKDGMEVLKDVHQIAPHVKTLILSMYPEEQYARRAIKNGAAGYLTKDSASEELVTAVRHVYNHGKYITPTLAEELANIFSDTLRETPHERLSDREYQVLILMGKGKKIAEIAEQLHLSINTVNSYRRRMLIKLRLSSTAECIKYTIEHKLTD